MIISFNLHKLCFAINYIINYFLNTFQSRQSPIVQTSIEQRNTKDRERDRGDREDRKERQEHTTSNRDGIVNNKAVSIKNYIQWLKLQYNLNVIITLING